MKIESLLTFFTLFYWVKAQNFEDLPACAQQCVAKTQGMLSGMYHCGDDKKCVCSNGFKKSLEECANSCKGDESSKVTQYGAEYCGSNAATSALGGFTWPSTTTIDPTSSSNPSSDSPLNPSSTPEPSSQESAPISTVAEPSDTSTKQSTEARHSASPPDLPRSTAPPPPAPTTRTDAERPSVQGISDKQSTLITSASILSTRYSSATTTNSNTENSSNHLSEGARVEIGIGAACGVLLIAGCIIGAYIYGKRRAGVEPIVHTEPGLAGEEQKGCSSPTPEIDGNEVFRSELESPVKRFEVYEKG